jgi:hypothetical protein
MKRSIPFLAACMSLTASRAAAEPGLVPVQGVLTNAAGEPIHGEHRLTFVLYRGEDDDDRLFTDDYRNQQVSNGHFVVYLGSQEDNALDLALFAQESEVWLETIVDGSEVIRPRTRLGSVPYAGYAQYCGAHTHDWSEITSGVPDLVEDDELQDARPTLGYDEGITASATLNGTWTTLPGLSVTITLRKAQPVLMGFSLSVSATESTAHCNFRYAIGTVGQGHETYGNVIVMGRSGTHWQSVSDFIVRPLGAGEHTVVLQGSRVGGVDPGACIVDTFEYSAPTLFAVGFP